MLVGLPLGCEGLEAVVQPRRKIVAVRLSSEGALSLAQNRQSEAAQPAHEDLLWLIDRIGGGGFVSQLRNVRAGKSERLAEARLGPQRMVLLQPEPTANDKCPRDAGVARHLSEHGRGGGEQSSSSGQLVAEIAPIARWAAFLGQPRQSGADH